MNEEKIRCQEKLPYFAAMRGLSISGLVLMLLASSCKEVIDPLFEDIQDLKIGKLEQGIQKVSVSAGIRFHNPNRFGMHLKEVDCDLYADNNLLGHFTNLEAVKISPQSQFTIPVKGEIGTPILLQYSGRVLLREPTPIRVAGKIKVGRAGFYKTVPLDHLDTIVLKW